MTRTPIRRAFIDRRRDVLGVELADGTMFYLPQAEDAEKPYGPDALLLRVSRAGCVDLSLWRSWRPA